MSQLSVRRRKQYRIAGATLLWTGVSFCLYQLAFIVYGEILQPTVYDGELAEHYALLKTRCQENPDQPLLVALGSSHVTAGFRPERLPPLIAPDSRTVMPFNMAHSAGGPIYALFTYRRLVKAGHTPRWLMVEMLPLLMRDEGSTLYGAAAVAGELAGLRPYVHGSGLYKDYARSRFLVPWQARARALLQPVFAGWLEPPRVLPDDCSLDRLGGSVRPFASVDRQKALCELRDHLKRFGCWFPEFHPDVHTDAAFRRLLGECRAHGTEVAILIVPDSPEYRRTYSALALQQMRLYARKLCCDFDAQLVDAQEWLPEADFADGHHLNASGQAHFTDRLGREFLQDWVRGSTASSESFAESSR